MVGLFALALHAFILVRQWLAHRYSTFVSPRGQAARQRVFDLMQASTLLAASSAAARPLAALAESLVF